MKEFIDAVVAAFRSLLETVFTQVEQNTSTIAAQQEILQEHGAIIVDLAERVAKLEGAPAPDPTPDPDPSPAPDPDPVPDPDGSVFSEPEPGLLMAQAEKFVIAGTGFEVQSDVPGYSGSGYITYTGQDSFEKWPGISAWADFTPTTSGTYQLQIHNRADDPNDPSQGNDTWAKINGESFYADDNGTKVFAKGTEFGETNVTTTNDSSAGYLKFYSNAKGAWTMQTSAIDNKPRQIMVELEAGTRYTIWIAGRSNGHSIDAVFLRHMDLDPSVIDKYLGVVDPTPVEPDPVDPPADDITVEIVSRGSLTPGAKGLFEAVVSDYSNVATVDFFLNGKKVHTEKQHKYEYEPTIPSTEFEMSVQVNFNNGKAQIAGSKVFVPVSAPPVGGGGGGDPTPTPGTGIEEYDALVAAADETWYDFNAASSGLSDGFVSETAIKGQFNASDAFMGLKYNNTRYKFESQVPEMGNIPGLLLFTPPGANNANFQERVSIPKTKDVDYTPGREVAVAMDFFFLSAANKTGNVDVDIRTYNTEPHVKRNGLQSFQKRPGAGTNPVGDGGGCEFVLMSQYDAETFANNFPYGNKGDQYGLELPQGVTTFDLNGTYEGPFDVNSPAYTRDRMILACGIYGHDVTDYNFQSQAFPCYPGTNIRMTFAPDTLYEMRWAVGMNSVSNGVSNQDGYFRWWIRNENVNGGDWFLACQLNNRDWTGNVPMLLANLGNGCYYGGNGKGYYLNDGATANGLWFTKSSAHVKI